MHLLNKALLIKVYSVKMLKEDPKTIGFRVQGFLVCNHGYQGG